MRDRERRCQVLAIDSGQLLDLVSEHLPEIVAGLPLDVRPDAVCYDANADCFLFRLASAEFEPVPLGYEIPRFIAEHKPTSKETAQSQVDFFFPPESR